MMSLITIKYCYCQDTDIHSYNLFIDWKDNIKNSVNTRLHYKTEVTMETKTI